MVWEIGQVIETDQPQVEVELGPGRHVVELVVVDDAGLESDPDTVVITVKQVRITGISGPAGHPSTAVEVVIEGQNLDDATGVKFFYEGVEDPHLLVDIQAALVTPEELPISIDIDTDAALGARSFQVFFPGDFVAESPEDVTFTVEEAPPEVPIVDPIGPISVQQGEVVQLYLTGQHLAQVTAIVFPPESGIPVLPVAAASDTQLYTEFGIPPDARPGTYGLQLETPLGLFDSGLILTVEAAQPLISSIDPYQGQPGETLRATITGMFLAETTAVIFPAVSGISTGALSAALREVGVDINASDALPGSYPFQLETPLGLFGSGAVTFTVGEVQPVVEAINPDHGQQGEALAVTISGQHLGLTTAVVFPQESGIVSGDPTAGDTAVEVELKIAEDAVLGSYPFLLASEDVGEVESGEVVFTVQQPVAPPVIETVKADLASLLVPPFPKTVEAVIYGKNLYYVEKVTFLTRASLETRWSPDPNVYAQEWHENPLSRWQELGVTFRVLDLPGTGDHAIEVTTSGGQALYVLGVKISVSEISGIGPVRTERLESAGIPTVHGLVAAGPDRLAEVLGVSETQATGFIEEARRLLEG